ncbi:MAG: hypothetical protein ACLRVQ_05580 [Lachnospiraceae bacterium]
MKTKLGLSNYLTASIFYFFLLLTLHYFNSGIFALPALVLGAYVLYKEEDLWLRASVIKGILLVVFVCFICLCINYVDDLLSFINFFINIADPLAVLDDGLGIMNWLKDIIYVIEKIIFMLLALFALGGKTVKLPVIDKLIAKHIQ